jgi:hypothetical protein
MKSIRAYLVAAVVIIASPVTITHADEPPLGDPPLVNEVPNNCGISISADQNWLSVNDNDDNNDEIWDFETESGASGAEPVVGEKDTLKITVTGTADKSEATVTVSIDTGSDKIDGFWEGTLAISGQTLTSAQLEELALKELEGQKKGSSKKTTFTFPVLEGSSATQTLYIEGIKHSDSLKDVKINARIEAPAGITPDPDNRPFRASSLAATPLEITVYQVDLDVDSNNNEGTEFTPGSDEEDKIEASVKPDGVWTKRPGKIIMVNDGFGDDIPDWADGFISDVGNTACYTCGPPITFIPMLLERKPPFTLTCTVKFTYSASDPGLVSTTSGGGFPDCDKQFTKPHGKLIRIWKKNNDGTIRIAVSVVYGGDYVPDEIEIPWNALSDGSVAHLWVEAVDPSGGLADISVVARIKEGDVECSDEIRMTAVKITCEPITAKPNQGYYPYNPAGVVAGDIATFRIDVEPEEYPDEEIKWHKTFSGATLIPSIKSGTIREAEFAHRYAGWGDETISVDITGNYYCQPMFMLRVYSGSFSVPLNCFVVSDGAGTPALALSDLPTMISILNDIYRQAGLNFTLGQNWILPISYNDWYECDTEDKELQVVNYKSDLNNGLELYFVKDLPYPGITITKQEKYLGVIITNTLGMICRTDETDIIALSKVVAHEIGHCCGLEDIYIRSFDERLKAKSEWSWLDWPASVGFNSDPSYYKRLEKDYESTYYYSSTGQKKQVLDAYAMRQKTLIQRLLMYGESTLSLETELDLPLGRVHGTTDSGAESDVEVGLIDMDRPPPNHH